MTTDHHDGEGTSAETMASGRGTGRGSGSAVQANDQIGPYRLIEMLGEGGMGEVWLAEQKEPVRRQVALKVTKLGMDTKEVVARFEAERQALAMMDHPNVARVYDGGATPNGRPYFVMEHIQGVPITEHCDRHKLNNRERLELFRQVCAGVQHAHQKAVIHRDIKPSNVLVTIRDDQAIPKIIDFGVAKATGPRLTDETLHTRLGMMIGTPAYMSPEQAEATGQDVDTRTDVYSLGVLLYELLVGALPFDPDDLRNAGLAAMVRKIREDEPPKPSTRLTTMGEHSTASAKDRRTELPALKREVAGDLDWITLKALEKDRTRRYSSPMDMAADIERYLTDQPVLASPPSVAYRTRKFVRRHTGAVVTTSVALLALVGFAGLMTVQAKRIATERDRANQEAEVASRVSDFLKELFTVSDPSEARGNSITARELLDRGSQEVRDLVDDQPEIGTELMNTMGYVYRQLGLYPEAESLVVQALQTRTRTVGRDHPSTLDSMAGLAWLHYLQGTYDRSEPLTVEALEGRQRVLGSDHPSTLGSMNNLATLYQAQSRTGEAEALFVHALEARREILGDDDPETLTSMNNLAGLHYAQGNYEEAEPLWVETLATRRRVLGDDHPETLISINSLAALYKSQNRDEEAEALDLEAVEVRTRVLGPEHPATLRSMTNLAVTYLQQSRYDDAEPLLLTALDVRTRVLGDEHPSTLDSMNNLALLRFEQGRYGDAEPVWLDVLDAQTRIRGADHPTTGLPIHNLACLYRDSGRHDEAQRFFERAQALWVAKLGAEHPYVVENLTQWAALLRKTGDSGAADAMEAQARGE